MIFQEECFSCDTPLTYQISLCYLDTTEKLRQKFKYFEDETSFLDEIKSILHHFKGLSVAKVFPREYRLLTFKFNNTETKIQPHRKTVSLVLVPYLRYFFPEFQKIFTG